MRAAFLALCALFVPRVAAAHDGPAYPIIVDRPLGGGTYLFSVWTDPDVGDGTFYLMFDRAPDRPLPAQINAAIWVEPIDHRLPPVRYIAEPMKPSADGLRKIAITKFDVQGSWHARFVVGTSTTQEDVVESDVDVTPPGGGPLSMAWYLMPFAIVAFIWLKAAFARRAP
jgi:hypothetical protein